MEQQENTTKVFLLTGKRSCHAVDCQLLQNDRYGVLPPLHEGGGRIAGLEPTLELPFQVLRIILQNTKSEYQQVTTIVKNCTITDTPASDITGTSAGLALVLAMAASWSGLNGKWNQIAATGILSTDTAKGYPVSPVEQIQKKLEIAVQCLGKQGAILYPEENHKEIETEQWFRDVKDEAAKKNITMIKVSSVEQAVQECFEISSQPGEQQPLSQPGMGCKKERMGKQHSLGGLGLATVLLTAGLVATAWLLRPATTPQSPAEQHEEKTLISGESKISAANREALEVRPEDPLQHPGYAPCD